MAAPRSVGPAVFLGAPPTQNILVRPGEGFALGARSTIDQDLGRAF